MQVHRLRDAVAVYLDTGETVYLTPKDAKRLASAINRTARDITKWPWLEQPHGSTIVLSPDSSEEAKAYVHPVDSVMRRATARQGESK